MKTIAKMLSSLKETIYLVSTGVIVTFVSSILILRFATRLTNAINTSPLPLWQVFVLVPVALYLHSKHYWLFKMRIHNTRPAPVYPHRDPVFGLDWIIDMSKALKTHTLLQFWDSLLTRLGGTFWVQNVGDWLVITNEPENVKAVHATRFEDWHVGGIRHKVISLTLGPRAIFAVNGQEWHETRAMIRPSFVRNQIADLECTDRHVDNFLARLPTDGTKVDLQQLLYRFTMDVSTDFMFGHSTNTLTNPTPEALEFTRCFEYAPLHAITRARLGWITLLLPSRQLDESVVTCRRFIDQYVEAMQASDKKQERDYVFMKEVLASGASKDYVRDQLLSMILGGRDTGASTMSSLFWILARRPDVVNKMRREIAVLQGRKPSWEELKNLKYVNMVLKEVLRLWAPVASNMRIATVDTILPKGGGPDGQSPLFVPKGAGCRWSSYSLHRRKDIYGDDANEFRPERWEKLRVSWGYIPFGGGPRICLGQQFALTQMLYLVTRMLQMFGRVDKGDDLPMTQEVSITIKLVNGCWVKLTRE